MTQQKRIPNGFRTDSIRLYRYTPRHIHATTRHATGTRARLHHSVAVVIGRGSNDAMMRYAESSTS